VPKVQRKLTEAHRTHDNGLPLVPERKTVAEFLTEWLDGQRSRLRPGTWKRYEEYVRIHAVPAIGGVKLAELGPQHLSHLYAQRLETGLSPATVHHIHAVLHRALCQAVRWDLVARNVADLVDAPRAEQREMAALTTEQVRTLLDGAADGPLEAILTLAVTTGMRKGELLALRWGDIDLDRGTVRVTGTMRRHPNGQLAVTPPKTHRSRRLVELSSIAVAALRRHRAKQSETRLLLGPEWNEGGFVFPSSGGVPQDGSHLLYGQFHPLLKRLGLPLIRCVRSPLTMALWTRPHPPSSSPRTKWRPHSAAGGRWCTSSSAAVS
jgi:integrase